MVVTFTARGRTYKVPPPWKVTDKKRLIQIIKQYPRLIHLFYLFAILEKDDVPKRKAVLSLRKQMGGA